MNAPARIIAAWPAMMKRQTAAAYCDMTEAAFEVEVHAGRLPLPVMLGKREHWRKAAIDRALDMITGDLSGEGVPDYRANLRARYEEK